jgi:glycosyltransferase involved in cell wall biosynthesis
LSHTTAHDIRQILDVPLSQIDVIPNGISPHFKTASPEVVLRVREQYGLPERFFLYVGTLEPRKNVARLIQAWDRSLSSTDLDLVIAGRTGWKTRDMEMAVNAIGTPKRLHFPGYIPDEDLPALITAAHAFVWPSLWEGFGIPPLEAMACGTPVLTSNVSCLPEIMGDAAIYVNPAEIDDIASGMTLVALDEDLRESLVERGRTQAAKYSWERVAKLTFETYEKAMLD